MSPLSTIIDDTERKDQIAASALDVFSTSGFSETTVQQIADEAGISKGTIYLYYDSKTDILVEVFNNFEATLHDLLDEILARSDRPADKLEELLSELVALVRSNRPTFKVLFDFWSHSLHHPDQTGIDFQSFYGRLEDKLTALLQDGIEKGVFRNDHGKGLASILIGFFEGQIVQWLINPDSSSLDAVKETGLALLLEGLASD